MNGRRYEGTPGTLGYRIVDFQRYAIRIEPREVRAKPPPSKAMGLGELLSSGKPEDMAELHWRIALPLAVVIMGLFAVPLSFVNPRSGRSWNLIFAVLIYVVYNNTLSIFQAWTSTGRIPTWVGLWPVHIAMLAVTAILFYRQVAGFRWRGLMVG
jgi:lipopolysaccharide export system permease protein